MEPRHAQQLAYFSSADGLAVLAPRVWTCEANSGSSGAALDVSPKGIARSNATVGPAIEIYHINSENSGRLEVAEIMGRLFPARRAPARRVWQQTLDSPFPSAPFPKDELRYIDKSTVRYRTPPYTKGLGTHSVLQPGNLRIEGLIQLVDGELPEAYVLYVRLPPALAELSSVIVEEIQHPTAVASRP
jgi:hypothetical protein